MKLIIRSAALHPPVRVVDAAELDRLAKSIEYSILDVIFESGDESVPTLYDDAAEREHDIEVSIVSKK